MMQPSGIRNILGYGNATVGEDNDWYAESLRQLEQQKQNRLQNKKYEDRKKEQDDKELYGLVGDALDLKDFNPVIHDNVKKAQIELAKDIKANKPSYADTYIKAQNKAAELGRTSTDFNTVDEVIAASKKEHGADKRINTANIEAIARKMALDDFKKNGKVDPSKNYFDEALNQYPQFALTDKSDFTVTDFIPEELQKDLKGGYKVIRPKGGYDDFDWNIKEYAPAFYYFKDNGQTAAPTLTTKSEPSGFVDKDNNPIPMLSGDAYGRFKATPSNVLSLNLRLQNRLGKDFDLKSQEAETFRKMEAYKDVERNKPRVNSSRIQKADPIRIYNSSGSGANKNAGADWVTRAMGSMKGSNIQNTKDIFSELMAGDITKLESVEDLGGGKVKVKILPKPKYDIMGQAIQKSTEPVERTFDVNSRTLPYELQNLYQSVMGGDVKLEKTYFPPNQSGSQATNSTYTIKGKKYSLAELKKMGYTEQQVSSYKDK